MATTATNMSPTITAVSRLGTRLPTRWPHQLPMLPSIRGPSTRWAATKLCETMSSHTSSSTDRTAQVATPTSSAITVVSQSRRAPIPSVAIKTSLKDHWGSMLRSKIARTRQFHLFHLSVTSQLLATFRTLSIVSKSWRSRMSREMKSRQSINLRHRRPVRLFSRYHLRV